jgi:uncharacterized membrane protein YhaH (DUF805 family)
MDMVEAYKKALRHYADFGGRAARREFWLYTLMLFLMLAASSIIEGAILQGITGGAITLLINLFHIVPSIAVSARRLHDIGKSGWWLFLMLIPLVGSIILLVFYCTRSRGGNEYGPSPA